MSQIDTAVSSAVPRPVPVLDVAAKSVLVLLLAMAVLNPATVHLEDKAATARAVGYPMLAFAVPLTWYAFWRDRHPFPWVADLLVTIPCFSDTLGNRMDLYDRIVWFDDAVHFVATGLLAAAIVVLTLPRSATVGAIVERSLAFGVTAALAWEIAEYFAFLSHHTNPAAVYADTLSDMTLGSFGALTAGLLIHWMWQRDRLLVPPPPAQAWSGDAPR